MNLKPSVFIVCIFFTWQILQGQIVITEEKTKLLFSEGNVLAAYLIPGDTEVDIGNTGEGNVYNLNVTLMPIDSFEVYSVSDIPKLASRFPDDGLVLGTAPIVDAFPFLSVLKFGTDTLFTAGSFEVFRDMEAPDTLVLSYDFPASYTLPFPTTYNKSWSYTGTRIDSLFDYDTGDLINTVTSDYSKTYTMDGSGNLQILGEEFDCLRETEVIEINGTISYKHIEFYAEGLWIILFVNADASETGTVTTSHMGLLLVTKSASQIENKDKNLREFRLDQNIPNPFNPVTTISYSTQVFDLVKLEVFNLRGERVETLVNEYQHPGTHAIDFDAGRLTSGIYFYRIKIGQHYQQTRKMILVR